MFPPLHRFIRLSPEVSSAVGRAVRAKDPKAAILGAKIVLLESAILTHGMPHPTNYEMVRRVQEIIREKVNYTDNLLNES